jgi:hypothetical protein
LTDLLSLPLKEYPALQAALSFMPALPPEEVVAALRTRVQALDVQLARISGIERASDQFGLPRLFSIEGEYEAHMVAAERDFVRKLVDEIESGSLDGMDQWRSFHVDDPEEGQ